MVLLFKRLALCALLCTAVRASADVTVGVDPAAPWQGYMNFFNLAADGGGYAGGSGWGTADLTAVFTGPTLTLGPNVNIGRDVPLTDTFWWKPDGTPNKNMDANFYVEKTNDLSGQMVTFTGNVLANTLVSSYTSVAFIKDFAPDYSSFNVINTPLVPGAFSISMNTDAAAGRHVQYGFETFGPFARPDEVQRLGNVQITAAAPVVPEPSSLALLGAGLLGLLGRRRRS